MAITGNDLLSKLEERKKKNKEESQSSQEGVTGEQLLKKLETHKQYKSTDTSGVDEKYINTFVSDANNLFSGVGDRSISYTDANNKLQDLNSRYDILKAYIYQNKDRYDEESYRNFSSTLDSIKGNFDKINSYYSQWGSEEDYQYALRLDGYQKKYDGKSYWDLMNGVNESDIDEEERDWIESHKFDYVKNTPDFDSVSAEGWEKYQNYTEKKKNEAVGTGKYKDEEWWETLLRYIGGSNGGGITDTTLPMHQTTQVQHDLRGDTSHLEPKNNWTDEQNSIYGYLLMKDPNAAAEYAKITTDANNKAAKEELISGVTNFADDNPFTMALTTLASLGMSPLGLADSLYSMVTYNEYGYVPETEYPMPGEFANAIQKANAQALNEKYGTIDESVPIIGEKGLGDVYQLGLSIANSLGIAHTQGPVGAPFVFFGSAYASGFEEAKERGATDEQAIAIGTLSGLAEVAGEQISIEHLLSIKGSKELGNVFLEILKQAGIEASEEGVTTVLNNFADQLVMGDKSNFNILVNQYMTEEGLSEEEAKKKAWASMAEDLAFDMVAGAASGGVSAGVQIGGSNAIESVVGSNTANKLYGESSADLVNESLSLDPNNAFAKKMYGRLESGKTLTGSQLNRLAKQNQTTLVNKDAAAIQSAVENRLTTLGETGDVSAIAKALTNWVQGQEISKAEKKTIRNSKYGLRVANEMNPENIRSGGYSSAWAEKIGTDKIYPAEYGKSLSAEENAEDVTENATAHDIAVQAILEGSESVPETAKVEENVEVKEIASVKDGEVMVRLDGGEVVNAREANLTTETEGLLYEAVAQMSADPEIRMDAVTANDFVKGYDPAAGVSVAEYIHGFKDAFLYGAYGFAESELERGVFTSRLSETQRRTAHGHGKLVGQERSAQQQAKIDSTVSEKTAKDSTSGGKKGKVYRDFAAAKTLNARQKQSLKALEVVAESLGVDIHVFESEVGEDGKRTGANGWYDPSDNSIHIDLYAGALGEATMLFTAAHELTHFIREWSPAKFKTFADFLLEQYGEKGVSVEQLVQRQIEKAKRNGRDISFDEAYEEVIADSCEAMLTDSNAMEKIAMLKAQDKSLWSKIKKFISDLVAKINEVYKGLNPDSLEANYVREMKDAAEKLYEMWTEALVDAGDSYQASALVEIDTDSDSVAPMLSERTWTASEYVTERELTAKKISKDLGVDIDTAYKYIDDINSVARLIADDRARLDYEPNLDSTATVIKPNSDYKWSVDMSTLCAKRLLFTGTFDALQKMFPNTAFDSDDIVRLRSMMEERGYEVACGICYVESTRREIGTITADFIERYKEAQKTGKPITRINSEGKVVELKKTKDQMGTTADKSSDKFFTEEGYTPTLAELNTTDIDLVKKDHPLVYEAYLNFMNARGQAKPKLLETRAEYKGEILKHFKYKSAVTSRNNAGGLRLQSFSDFEVPHLIDMMQITMDMARVGLKAQAYTKVPNFAEAFGNTGIKINLSLIAKGTGLNSNGNLVFDDVEGINHKEAFRLRDKFSKNVGTILVGKNNAHIIAAMADPRIDYIIPFHKSSWKESLYDALGLTGYDDYTDWQNEKPIDKSRTIKNFDPSEYWDFSKTGDENAQIYLEKCRQDGRIPKFSQFQGYPGYWKLLIDFKMYDNDGVGSPQNVVQPIFDDAVNQKILREYQGGHRSFPVAKDVVRDFAKEYKSKVATTSADDVRYSFRDSESGMANDKLSAYDEELRRFIEQRGDYIIDSFKKLEEVVNLAFDKPNVKATAYFGIINARTLDKIKNSIPNLPNASKEILFKGGRDYSIATTLDSIRHIVDAKSLTKKDVINYLDRLADTILEFDSVAFNYYTKGKDKVPGLLFKKAFADGTLVSFDLVSHNKRSLVLQTLYMDSADYQKKKSAETLLMQNANSNTSETQVSQTSVDSIAHKSDSVKRKFSYRDSSYMDAVNRGDMETAQKMVDEAAKEAGYTIKGSHGTLSYFTIFDRSYGNAEGDWGKGFYFTNNEADVETNYASADGADLQVKIEKYAEQLGWTEEYGDLDYDELIEVARKELTKGEPRVIKAYLKMDNPVVVGGQNETYFDYTEDYNEETDEYGEPSGKLVEFVEALASILEEYASNGAIDADNVNVYELFQDGDGYTASQLEKAADDLLANVMDENGDYASKEIIRAAFEEIGFDGIVDNTVAGKFGDRSGRRNAMVGVTIDTTHYVAFKSNQIKQSDPVVHDDHGNVIPLSERFNTKNSDIRYSDRDSYAPTFYSHMGKVVDGIKSEKVGATGVVPYLKGKGVKAEEIKWSGIEAWLEGKKSVTKAELQEFVAGSQLQIEEQMSDRDIELRYDHSTDSYTVIDSTGDVIDTYTYNSELGGYKSENDDEVYEYASDLEKEMRWAHGTDNAPQHSQYKIEGGENYRELVFVMPNSSYHNRAMRAHWGEDAAGILAHARMQDITTDDGKKMLFIEEIQSDWHNEGRNEGYSDSRDTAKLEALESRANELFFKVEDYSTKMTGLAGEWETIEKTAEGAKLLKEYREAQEEYERVQDEAIYKIPDAPFRNNYHEYVLKRLIRMAAEEGYDSIGWTTADIQSERWSSDYAESYRIEYDQDMPSFMRKYGKKWGAKVGKTEVAGNGITTYTDEYDTTFKSIRAWVDFETKRISRLEGSDYSKRLTVKEDGNVLSLVDKETGHVFYNKLTVDNGNIEVWSMDIPAAMKNSVLYEGQAMYQDRDPDSVSNRSLLANALDGVAQNDIERSKLAQYKQKIELIQSEERELHELREQIKELSFAKGPKDTAKIRSLQSDATRIANRINTFDRQLLTLEASAPLKAVLEREKAFAYKKAEKKGKEALARYKEKAADTQRELMTRYQESRKKGIEGRHKTEMRHKIKDVVSELNQYLLRGTKDHHVPIELQKAVAEALDAVNMDTVGAEERIAKLNEEMMRAKTPEKVQEISRKIDRIKKMGDRMDGKLKALKAAYDKFTDSDDPLIANSHDEVISSKIESVIESVGDTPLRDMTLRQLEDVYDMYRMVLTTVRNANKAFKAAKNESIAILGNRVMMEVDNLGKKKAFRLKGVDGVESFAWNSYKPVFAFERIGSKTLSNIYSNVRAGEDVWATDVTEAKEFYREQSKKYKYDSWDFSKRYDFRSTSGKDFSLSLDQIMSLYAYSKREQAAEHLKRGGIVFDESTEVTMKTKLGFKAKFNPMEATAYNLSDQTLADIISKLTPEQKAFVDVMQDYLSTTMGAKGNEVSLELYGIKLFKEKHYFPLKSAPQFMAIAKEQQQGTAKIKNSGFSKETVQKASNPIVLTPFMNVWSNHVNDMSMYHAFVLAMEDFYRVYNYKTPTSDTMATESVEMFIQNAYGKGATQYIDQLLKDLNGGARTDPRAGVMTTLIGKFKKSAVFASASVVIQQPSAIARALSLVDAKYFVGKMTLRKHSDAWAEVKKYAPVAIIKEMGYFDTNMGVQTTDWIIAKEYSGFSEKVKALFTDGDFRDEMLSKAPALADELSWCYIWEAVKRETRATTKLQPGSEEFLAKAGERFTEVITKTQVYDSVLSRSGLMRSKDTGLKMATAFMAEPTTSLNMIADAIVQGKRGNKAYAARTIGAVAASMILNSILVSFVYAGRDDDEDKTYAEKYIGTLTEELLDSFNPLTLIPFVKDVVSIFQGYDVERSDMAVVTDLVKAWKNLSNDNRSVYRKVEDFAGAIAAIFGLPVKNIMRDARAMYNTINSFLSGKQTTGAGIKNAVTEAVTGKEMSKSDKLYDAMESGDSAMLGRIESQYKDQDAFELAVRQALRGEYEEGDLSDSQAVDMLVDYGGKAEDDAIAMVMYWAFKQDNPDTYVDDSWFSEYYEDGVSDAGISIEMFVEYRNEVKDITGEGKKERHMAVINSLPITNAQKDALYFAEGWTESRLYEAPWR